MSDYVNIGSQCTFTSAGRTYEATVVSNPTYFPGTETDGLPNQVGGEPMYILGDITPSFGNQSQVIVRAAEVFAL